MGDRSVCSYKKTLQLVLLAYVYSPEIKYQLSNIKWLHIYTEQKKKRYTTIFYFCDKVLDKKYLLKLNKVSQHPANDSLKLNQIVSFNVWVMCLFVLSFIHWILQLPICKKGCLLIRIGHTHVALKLEKTDLSLKTSLEIIFQFNKFVNCLPLTKTNREYN